MLNMVEFSFSLVLLLGGGGNVQNLQAIFVSIVTFIWSLVYMVEEVGKNEHV